VRGNILSNFKTYYKATLIKTSIRNLRLRAGYIPQVVEHLPSKHKVLSATPSTEEKKKKTPVTEGGRRRASRLDVVSV
jgi:hypothetical protein